MTYKKALAERFWKKVDIKGPDECWEWKASLRNDYGQIKVNGRMMRANRVAWELTNGMIPDNKLVLHKCDNRKCVNPNHLYIGTKSDNVLDRANRNPNNQGGGLYKLHTGEIWLIRKLKVITGRHGKFKYKFSASYIASMFKISHTTVLRIWSSSKYLSTDGIYA
jgi:hypothetical protein